MGNPPVTVPNLLSLIPEGNPKLIIRFCFDDLNLSVCEAERDITAARRMISSMDWLMRGGDIPSSLESE
jgi:hypothetical protein